ncbi:gamma-aminobutyraldehyde dehydrogenase [Escherichia coli]|uniref:Gamma-aminobutyraldehyde dehydrogenase n=1 Tax=Escherichia coli TaxID=562 RepID=A0A2X1KWV7_ECOLX|nr:gamma-aminobutyraldehyde dehydrogenase [Escherichia coli]
MGDPLTGHPKVRMVSLTGSIATGEHIISHTRVVPLSVLIWNLVAKRQ